MIRRASVMVVGALCVSSCTQLLAPRADFGAYRRFLAETDPDRRTTAGAEYLEHNTAGRFRAEIEREIGNREEEYWEQRRSTLDGLRAYLTTYPHGNHVQEARGRIAVYEGERQRVTREQQTTEQQERERLAAERRANSERQRLFARNTFLFWLRTLGGLDGWGEAIPTVAQRNPDFNTAFGGEPAPVCRAGRCRKTFHVDYTVPIPGRTALARAMDMQLHLIMRERRIVQGALVMQRRGLSNWYECETQGACDPADPEQRQRSVHWAMDQLRGIVATAFPDARETPQDLVGPEPEMEGAEDDSATDGQPTPAPTSPILPQPLGVQWSFVVGCGGRGGAQITIPENARPAGWAETTGQNGSIRSCLRIDAYSAPDVEGVNTDEGLRITWIPASALPARGGGGGARPPRRGH